MLVRPGRLFGRGRRRYLGHLTTRGYVADGISTNNKQAMCRVKLTARADMASGFQIVFPNWCVANASHTETGSGADLTITAAVEYPAGTFTQVTFSGSTSGTIPDLSNLVSDPVALTIPKDTDFFVRAYVVSTVGTPFTAAPCIDVADGDAYKGAASGVTDMTMSGTIPAGGTILYAPVSVIGWTTVPSALLIGDSKNKGTTDTVGSPGDLGQVARSIGPHLPYINAGSGGDRAQLFVASSTMRQALGAYCSHIISEYGGNDLSASRTLAQLEADMATIRAYWPTKPFFQTTLHPRTNSTDNFATLANQTAQAGYSLGGGNRETFNDNVRAGAYSFSGYFEMADVVESGRNTGLWKVTGVRSVTDAAITTGTKTLTSATAAFTSADIGTAVAVAGAGSAGATLSTTIAGVTNGTTATLAANAGTTVSGANASLGMWTNDGTHETPAVYLFEAASGAINPGIFH